MPAPARSLVALTAVTVASLAAVGLAERDSNRQPVQMTALDDGAYIAVVPAGTYQSIVISPSPGSGSVQFILRARTATGAADYPFFVPAGEIRSIDFPHGLALSTASALFAPRSISFAAWGISAGSRSEDTVTSGRLVRFEPLGRDTDRDDRDRQRGREFDEFLREVERTR